MNGDNAELTTRLSALNNPKTASLLKALESAEKASTSNISRSIKFYNKALQEYAELESIQEIDPSISSFPKDIKEKINALESAKKSAESASLVNDKPASPKAGDVKRSTTAPQLSPKRSSNVDNTDSKDSPSSKKDSAQQPDRAPPLKKIPKSGQSASSASITASTSETPSTHRSNSSKKKSKSRRVGVRFLEQKKLYFYEEDASPIDTRKVSAGFTSSPGLEDSDYEPLLRELLRIALIPVTTSTSPFPEKKVLEHLREAFGLEEDIWANMIRQEKQTWNIYKFIASLIERQKNLEQHPFYTADRFSSDQDYKYWMSTEEKRLERLIQRLKVLAPDYDEKVSSRDRKRKSKSKGGIEESSSTTSMIKDRKQTGTDAKTPNSVSSSVSSNHPLSSNTNSQKIDSIMISSTPAMSTLANFSQDLSDDSEVLDSGRIKKSPKSTNRKEITRPSNASEDSSQHEDSRSDDMTSSDGAVWNKKTPRVAIKPLQFSGDDTSEEATSALGSPVGSARRSDAEFEEDFENHYESGSDPDSNTPRAANLEQEPKIVANNVPRKPRVSAAQREENRTTKENHFVSTEFGDLDDEGAAFAEDRADISEEVKTEVSTAPSRYEILFKTLMNHEVTNLKQQEKRIMTLIPLLDKAHEEISNHFSLDTHVNMFDALPTLNPDAMTSGFSGTNFFLNIPDQVAETSGEKTSKRSKKHSKSSSTSTNATTADPNVPSYDPASESEKVLIGLSPIARWLLGEYAILWGYSPLYQNLVLLSHTVSFFSPVADKLLVLYVVMTRVLDLLQAEDLEPIPSALETYYFAQIMRELNRDAESCFYNIFGQFSYEDLAALKMLLNILSLIYECNEYLGEAPPKTYKAYLEQALEESIRNYYKDVIAEAEEPREITGDPLGTNTSAVVRRRQRFERRMTADQLIAACKAMEDLLRNLKPFQTLFDGLSRPLFDICCKAYIRQLFSDTSLFVIKLARSQPVPRVLALANGIIGINGLCANQQGSDLVDPLPVEKLFGSFLQDWLSQTEDSMKEWVGTTCKIERWLPVDQARGKMWSACSWDLYKLSLSHIPFVKQNETLFALTIAAEQAEQQGMEQGDGFSSSRSGGKSGLSTKINHKAIGFTAETVIERKKTFFYQYSLALSRVLRDFIENVYNLFVEEFPADLHSDLHDLYIRDYYNMTTGGTGLHMTYKKKKKSIFSWLPGRSKKSDDLEDPNARHASLASSSNVKLGKKKGASGSNTQSSEESSEESAKQKPVEQQDDNPNRELVIKVWTLVTFDPKRAIKLRKLRKRIDIKATMCTKLNDLDALRAFFEKLLSTEPLFQLATNPAFVLMHKVFRTFLHMIIYVMNMHLDTEMEHIYKKSTKKPASSVFESLRNFMSNLTEQLSLMKDTLRVNIFKRILLRVWKVIQEDLNELLSPEDEDGKSKPDPTAMQVAALEHLLESIRPVLTGYGMSNNHINVRIEELLGPVKSKMSEEELERARISFETEKDKFNRKEKKKVLQNAPQGATPGIRSSVSSPALQVNSVSSDTKKSRKNPIEIETSPRKAQKRASEGRSGSRSNATGNPDHRTESFKRDEYNQKQNVSSSSFVMEVSITENSEDAEGYASIQTPPVVTRKAGRQASTVPASSSGEPSSDVSDSSSSESNDSSEHEEAPRIKKIVPKKTRKAK